MADLRFDTPYELYCLVMCVTIDGVAPPLCLVVRVTGYRSRGPGVRFPVLPDFLRSSVGMERGPLSLVRITEDLPERESSGSGLENRN
jgi:hypothetical protein